MITVVADHRERSSGVIESLKAIHNVNVVVDTLAVGDYRVDQLLLVERKELFDFISSIKDGRLFRQARRLAAAPLPSVMLLEGEALALTGSGMRREALQGALISISLIFGIPVLRARNPQESASLMVYAANQIVALARGALPRKGKRPKGLRRKQIYILQGLPGIGPDRATQLLDSFGSVEAVMSANLRQLLSITGIGERTAKGIRKVVGKAEA